MKALSIRQPWAWLIIRPDIPEHERRRAYADGRIKDIENRSWSTTFKGRLLIHASKMMTQYEYDEACEFYWQRFHKPMMHWDTFEQRGGIIGSVEMTGCVASSFSPWFVGRFGFTLRDARPLPFRPMLGKLGLFDVPDA